MVTMHVILPRPIKLVYCQLGVNVGLYNIHKCLGFFWIVARQFIVKINKWIVKTLKQYSAMLLKCSTEDKSSKAMGSSTKGKPVRGTGMWCYYYNNLHNMASRWFYLDLLFVKWLAGILINRRISVSSAQSSKRRLSAEWHRPFGEPF